MTTSSQAGLASLRIRHGAQLTRPLIAPATHLLHGRGWGFWEPGSRRDEPPWHWYYTLPEAFAHAARWIRENGWKP